MRATHISISSCGTPSSSSPSAKPSSTSLETKTSTMSCLLAGSYRRTHQWLIAVVGSVGPNAVSMLQKRICCADVDPIPEGSTMRPALSLPPSHNSRQTQFRSRTLSQIWRTYGRLCSFWKEAWAPPVAAGDGNIARRVWHIGFGRYLVCEPGWEDRMHGNDQRGGCCGFAWRHD